jgi:putative protease
MSLLKRLFRSAVKAIKQIHRSKPKRASKRQRISRRSGAKQRRSKRLSKKKVTSARKLKKKSKKSKKKPKKKLPRKRPSRSLSKVKPKAVSNKKPRKEILIGEITHYFPRITVVVIKMKGALDVGQTIHVRGKSTDFVQKVDSLQIESINVKKARKGQLVGLKVIREAREKDKVYRLL